MGALSFWQAIKRLCYRYWGLRVRADQLDPAAVDLAVQEGLGQLVRQGSPDPRDYQVPPELQDQQAQRVAWERQALKAYREYLDQLDRLGLLARQDWPDRPGSPGRLGQIAP